MNSIEVKTSLKNLTDTAVVKVPRKMSWREKPLTDFINRNDQITIKAGYEEYDMQTLFEGYISTVENGTPVVITCENEMRRFKTINVKPEKIAKFDFKAYVEKYAPGVEVVQPENLTFGSMDITEEMTLAQAIDKITSVYTYVKGFFQDGKFYITLITSPFAERKEIVFSPDRNMISDSLKYTLAEDIKIGIKAVAILRNNNKLEAYAPADAVETKNGKKSFKNGWEQRQFFSTESTTQRELQDFADKKAAEFVTDKMNGTFTTFGVPFVRKGDNVLLKDKERKERDNKRFVVEAVDYSFGTSGYRQTVTLGDRLSK